MLAPSYTPKFVDLLDRGYRVITVLLPEFDSLKSQTLRGKQR